MPTGLIGEIPQLAALVEKLGLVGVLLLAVGWLVWDRRRLMEQGRKTFRQRDKARLICERYRSALVAAGAPVPDIGDIHAIYTEDKED